jgi:hypothetical protein
VASSCAQVRTRDRGVGDAVARAGAAVDDGGSVVERVKHSAPEELALAAEREAVRHGAVLAADLRATCRFSTRHDTVTTLISGPQAGAL